MTADEARDWIAGLQILGMRLGLDRIRALLAALGDPQRAAPAVHVVGTNGKSFDGAPGRGRAGEPGDGRRRLPVAAR